MFAAAGDPGWSKKGRDVAVEAWKWYMNGGIGGPPPVTTMLRPRFRPRYIEDTIYEPPLRAAAGWGKKGVDVAVGAWKLFMEGGFAPPMR